VHACIDELSKQNLMFQSGVGCCLLNSSNNQVAECLPKNLAKNLFPFKCNDEKNLSNIGNLHVEQADSALYTKKDLFHQFANCEKNKTSPRVQKLPQAKPGEVCGEVKKRGKHFKDYRRKKTGWGSLWGSKKTGQAFQRLSTKEDWLGKFWGSKYVKLRRRHLKEREKCKDFFHFFSFCEFLGFKISVE